MQKFTKKQQKLKKFEIDFKIYFDEIRITITTITFQSLMVLSPEALAIVSPSGEKQTELIPEVCPWEVI